MNPGLRYLLGMMPVVLVRRLRRQLRGGRWILALLVLVVVVLPQALAMVDAGTPTPPTIESTCTWAPLVLLLMLLMSLSTGVGFAFKPAEVDFLFPAPIARRDLLLYKLASSLAVATLTALWLALFFVRHALHLGYGLAGILLAIWFLQVAGLCFGVAAAAADVRMTRRVRVAAWSVVVVAAAAGVVAARNALPDGADGAGLAVELARALPVQVLAFPGRIYVEVFVAADLAAFLRWSAAGVLLLAVLVVTLLRLDVAWAEGSVRQSQVLAQRLRRVASEGMAGASGARLSGLRLAMLPRWGGAGPLVWRQATEAVRSLRSVLMTLAMFVAVPAVVLLVVGQRSGGVLQLVVPLLVITVMSPNLFAFDFRRDLDRMALLKSLPLAPLAIAAGQVAVPVLLRALLQMLVLGLVAACTRELPLAWLAATAVAVLPLNWMAAALDNTVFLLWPYRIVAKSGEMAAGPRLIFGALVKMLILLPAIALCAGAGALGWWATAAPLAVGAGVASTAAVIGAGLTLWLARCVERFDVAAAGGD